MNVNDELLHALNDASPRLRNRPRRRRMDAEHATKRTQFRRLFVEQLESRDLLAGLTGGTDPELFSPAIVDTEAPVALIVPTADSVENNDLPSEGKSYQDASTDLLFADPRDLFEPGPTREWAELDATIPFTPRDSETDVVPVDSAIPLDDDNTEATPGTNEPETLPGMTLDGLSWWNGASQSLGSDRVPNEGDAAQNFENAKLVWEVLQFAQSTGATAPSTSASLKQTADRPSIARPSDPGMGTSITSSLASVRQLSRESSAAYDSLLSSNHPTRISIRPMNPMGNMGRELIVDLGATPLVAIQVMTPKGNPLAMSLVSSGSQRSSLFNSAGNSAGNLGAAAHGVIVYSASAIPQRRNIISLHSFFRDNRIPFRPFKEAEVRDTAPQDMGRTENNDP